MSEIRGVRYSCADCHCPFGDPVSSANFLVWIFGVKTHFVRNHGLMVSDPQLNLNDRLRAVYVSG
jgi:hypothetical protein